MKKEDNLPLSIVSRIKLSLFSTRFNEVDATDAVSIVKRKIVKGKKRYFLKKSDRAILPYIA
ncbi:MAG: hypothetical protein HYT75_03155 [Deltaproteobacteria bacterium]|nr:hypothetical protein [Deltaproteobacteria bacterium]